MGATIIDRATISAVFLALMMLAALPTAVEITEISIATTPGKPMEMIDAGKPAEEIAAAKIGQLHAMYVRINVPRDGRTQYWEERVELTREEFASLDGIALKWKLLDWKPDPTVERVFDASTWQLLLRGTRSNLQRWDKPLKNEEGPSELRRAMARLAKAKAKSKLAYLHE